MFNILRGSKLGGPETAVAHSGRKVGRQWPLRLRRLAMEYWSLSPGFGIVRDRKIWYTLNILLPDVLILVNKGSPYLYIYIFIHQKGSTN